MQEEAESLKISRSDANQLISSLESAYYGLLLQGKYLPKLASSIITSDYLLGVLFDKIYVTNLNEVQIGVLLKSVKKYEIIEELRKIPLQQKSWRIDYKHLPDKDWITNVMKTLKPNHEFFQKYKQSTKYVMKTFTQEQINQIKELDTTMGKKKNVKRFFHVSEEKQLEAENQKRSLKKKPQKGKWIGKLKLLTTMRRIQAY
ncbi:unnamed protein product [Paramecium primaurelia]|uniref:Uncharacterized protein n=1 Tax=Paramecium primaurelia TaxID=5886 RepID=A0A8S1P2N1_PARPR|nr:unnamed protein product [Paramecium primaurelia]